MSTLQKPSVPLLNPTSPLASGMLGWEFYEASGTALHMLGGTATGTFLDTSRVTWQTDPTYGVVLQASAGSSRQLVQLGTPAMPIPPAHSYTMETFFKWDGVVHGPMCGPWGDGDGRVGLYVSTTGLDYYHGCLDSDGSGWQTRASLALPGLANQWAHVVVVVCNNGTSNGVAFFVNGTQYPFVAFSPGTYEALLPMNLSSLFGNLNGDSCTGMISFVRVWPRQLSATDLAPLWSDPWSPVRSATLDLVTLDTMALSDLHIPGMVDVIQAN